MGKGDAFGRGRVFPGQTTGEGERLMRAALLNAKAGLGADKPVSYTHLTLPTKA